MKTDVVAIERGTLQGVAALAIEVSSGDAPRDVLDVVVGSMRPGLQAILLVDAPWGDPSLDAAIGLLLSDERTHHLPIVAERDVRETAWAAPEIWWVGDASGLLAAPVNVSQLVDLLNLVPYHPQLSDVVVRSPDPANLHPSLLDEVFVRLNPNQAWIHEVPPQSVGDVVATVSRCATPWGVRR